MLKPVRAQVGDTLVEVLLCLAIVGLVLGAGYASSSRSMAGIRTAQERSEALKIAEGQLESLRGGTFTSLPTGIFCIREAAQVTDAEVQAAVSSIPTDPSADTYAGYHSDCRKGSGVQYHLAIFGSSAGVDQMQYQVAVRWDSLSGSVKNQVELYYILASPGGGP